MKKVNKSDRSEKSDSGDRVVDLEEAIRLLRTTRQTFYRWLRSGKLKGMKAGRQWRFYRRDIDRFMQGEGPRIEVAGNLKPVMEALGRRMGEAGAAGPEPGEATVERAVEWMMRAGKALGASDLHLEVKPPEGGSGNRGVIRYRIDGVLHAAAEFEPSLVRPLVERWKALGAVNIHETRVPQDCRIHASLEGKPVDLRVSFVPACLGEAMTARFLEPQAALMTLDRIPYAPRDRQALDRFLALPWGMLFVTGPVGSGKSTALYACLAQCAKPEAKTMTVEDPVEYLIPWATQIQVRPADGLTYPAAMRSILRSDPDVVMVGEIRDLESLRVAQQMALTGHLVMSTLHTDSAAGGLMRLCDVGDDPFMVADATKLVLAQRLLRKVCPECSRKAAPEREELRRAVELAKAGGLGPGDLGREWREARGCAHCRQTGYRGRTVMAEVLVVSPEIAAAIRRRAPLEELQALAVRQGMTTMAADGIRRAAAGETTLQEVVRMLPR